MKKIIFTISMLFAISLISFGQSYKQSGGTATKSNQAYTASSTDESGVVVSNSGNLTLSNSTVTTSGNTSSNDNSSFYGLNAGVLSESASTIILNNCKISTTGTGANGVFATGSGSSVTLTSDTINCTNDGGHGVDATFGGKLTLTDVVINTAGAHGAAISTDRGGGTINVTRGVATATGQDSPGIYCTGTISITDAIIVGKGSEGAVIEGANTIDLLNTSITGYKGSRDRGLLIYQSMSGDATGTEGKFTMTGGNYIWTSLNGPAMYVTNSTGVIKLTGVTISNSSPVLVKASADQWGTSGSNGGNVVLTASQQTLIGNMIADKYSTINATLQNNSSLSGAINNDNSAKSVSVSLDASSKWNVTAESYIDAFSDAGSITSDSVINLTGNGFNVYYDGTLSANSSLQSKTYKLRNGGYLTCNTVSGINNASDNKPNLKLYPNPVSDELTIETANSETQKVSIYNISGIKVYDGIIKGTKTIDFKQFESGNYIISINNETNRILVKH
ncbi:MAG: T9SS type A sorting domain-containing protein [Bacteroidota bacterium]|nr:T9SS type A sorting domain-containing protein [Bacteroidota bacterium]